MSWEAKIVCGIAVKITRIQKSYIPTVDDIRPVKNGGRWNLCTKLTELIKVNRFYFVCWEFEKKASISYLQIKISMIRNLYVITS